MLTPMVGRVRYVGVGLKEGWGGTLFVALLVPLALIIEGAATRSLVDGPMGWERSSLRRPAC